MLNVLLEHSFKFSKYSCFLFWEEIRKNLFVLFRLIYFCLSGFSKIYFQSDRLFIRDLNHEMLFIISMEVLLFTWSMMIKFILAYFKK